MMRFKWIDYDAETMDFVENWLDDSAVVTTGLDDGFLDFYRYWANEDGFSVGENFWCKVVFEGTEPFAVIALAQNDKKITIMEIVVAPEKRGQGRGSKLLKELHDCQEILGFSIDKSEAIIFPCNAASQKAFENAGFRHFQTYEDNSALIYLRKVKAKLRITAWLSWLIRHYLYRGNFSQISATAALTWV